MAAYQGDLIAIRETVIAALRLDTNGADDDKVNAWINLAYQEACQKTQALTSVTITDLTEAVDSYTLDPEIAEINLVIATYADGTVSAPLQRVVLETILEYRRTTLAEGEQLWNAVYTVVGQDQLEIWPMPGAGQSLTFYHSVLPDVLVDDTDSPDLMEPYGSKLLTYGALVEGCRFLKDPLLQDSIAQYQAWLAAFQTWLNRRQGQTSMGFRVRGTSGDGQSAAMWGLARDVG